MFDRIGSKIKNLAICICCCGIILTLITTFALWSENRSYNPTILPGLIILVIGCLFSWIGSFFTYALGVITENSELHIEMLAQLNKKQETVCNQLLEITRQISLMQNTSEPSSSSDDTLMSPQEPCVPSSLSPDTENYRVIPDSNTLNDVTEAPIQNDITEVQQPRPNLEAISILITELTSIEEIRSVCLSDPETMQVLPPETQQKLFEYAEKELQSGIHSAHLSEIRDSILSILQDYQ